MYIGVKIDYNMHTRVYFSSVIAILAMRLCMSWKCFVTQVTKTPRAPFHKAYVTIRAPNFYGDVIHGYTFRANYMYAHVTLHALRET